MEVGALASDQVARVDAGVSVDGSLQLLGMRVAEAEADTLADLGLSGGVVIEAVEPDSPAAGGRCQRRRYTDPLGQSPDQPCFRRDCRRR